MQWRTWIAVSALFVACGCTGKFTLGPPALMGSGIARDETRTIDPFHAFEVENALQVNLAVKQGAKPSLKISGDDNLVPLVESIVRDGKLTLRLKENTNVSTKVPLVADVVTDQLDNVEASGATNVKVTGGSKSEQFTVKASGAARVSVAEIQASKVVASAAGACNLVLAGTAPSLTVDASGASEIKAQDLKVEDADVTINGASNVELHASKSVGGDVSGASRLNLHGKPARKTVSTSGASHVNDEE